MVATTSAASSRKISSSSRSTSAPGASTSCTICGVGSSGAFSGAMPWIAWKTPVCIGFSVCCIAAIRSSALNASVDSDITAASLLSSSTAFSRRSFVSLAGASCQSS